MLKYNHHLCVPWGPRAKAYSHIYRIIWLLSSYLDMNVAFVSKHGCGRMDDIGRRFGLKDQRWKGSVSVWNQKFYCILFKSAVTPPSGFGSTTRSCSETKHRFGMMGTNLGFLLFVWIICRWCWLFFFSFPFAISVQKIYFYICNKFVIKNENKMCARSLLLTGTCPTALSFKMYVTNANIW